MMFPPRTLCGLLVFLFAGLATVAATVRASIHPYILESVGHLGGGSSRATAMNNRDEITGESETTDGRVEAFIWSSTSGIRSLGTLGGSSSRAFDINDVGMIVGESVDAQGYTKAFCWTEGEGMKPLPTPDNTMFSSALSVSESGDIVGVIEHNEGTTPVLWRGEHVFLLPRLPGTGQIQPLEVNRRGDLVGQIAVGDDEAEVNLAFYSREGTQTRSLAAFRLISAQRGSAAVAVNESGLCVGYVMRDSARVRAFRYHPDFHKDLELLAHSNYLYTTASDLNDDGWIAGSAIASYFSDESACLWWEDQWFDLNQITDTGGEAWWLVQATAINNGRAMAGTGTLRDSSLAFLLRPAPGIDPRDWPRVRLDVSESPDVKKGERVVLLVAAIPANTEARRISFFRNDQFLGSVEEPPYEWGWEGRADEPTDFFVEWLDPAGRRVRSARTFLPAR